MNMYDIILKKREKGILTRDEIKYVIEGFTENRIPDYQMSALLMTFFFNELTHDEIFYLTDAMKDSGDLVDLSAIKGIKTDKHSTGGVGDKTTFVVAPLAAACGVPIAKMSGRGLGFTGGTVDKMESIPGMRTELTEQEFTNQVNDINISVIGQTGHIAPADKKIYALRDVTATVDNLGLIASSIMSKKLAAGSDAIVLDVKCGNGAFMKSEEDAVKLGEIMVEIGKKAQKSTVAVVTNMNQPLGKAVGNSLEVIEAIETLKGHGPDDITELSVKLAAHMILAGKVCNNYDDAEEKAWEVLSSGKALKKFEQFVNAQGGNPEIIENYSLFGQAEYNDVVTAEKDGFVNRIGADVIGLASQRAGAGRAAKDAEIDMNSGIMLHKKRGDQVEAGDKLATIYADSEEKMNEALEIAKKAFEIKSDPPLKENLIKKVI